MKKCVNNDKSKVANRDPNGREISAKLYTSKSYFSIRQNEGNNNKSN